MAYSQSIDHVCLEPQGRPSRISMLGTSSASRADRARAKSRSFVATCQMRQKLADTDVVMIDDTWSHVRDGVVIAKFDSLHAAINAI